MMNAAAIPPIKSQFVFFFAGEATGAVPTAAEIGDSAIARGRGAPHFEQTLFVLGFSVLQFLQTPVFGMACTGVITRPD